MLYIKRYSGMIMQKAIKSLICGQIAFHNPHNHFIGFILKWKLLHKR